MVQADPSKVKTSGQLQITPSDLAFMFEPNKKMPTYLTITNPSEERILYKVRTNQPKKYIVKPSSGVIEPYADIHVQVVMQAQARLPDESTRLKDKFQVMSVPVTPEMGSEPVISNDLFKHATKGYGEAILHVQVNPAGGAVGTATQQQAIDWSLQSKGAERLSESEQLQMEVFKLKKQLDMKKQANKFGEGGVEGGKSGFTFLQLLLVVIVTFALTHALGVLLRR